MIASLKGVLAASTADHAVIEVGGIGYLVWASTRTLEALGAAGNMVSVRTEMQVREDAITLFAFATVAEQDWFRLLTSVQGVGSRVALAILSILSPDDLRMAVMRGDKAMIARANGVGPKLAQRIANELKDKAGGIAGGGQLATADGASAAAPMAGHAGDAISALQNLGFRPADASRAVALAEEELGTAATLDALVRLALKKAAR